MSELIGKTDDCATIRWKLLTGASALALVASISSAQADDINHPVLWFDLGGQFDRVMPPPDEWTPSTLGILAGSGASIRKEPAGSFGLDGGLSYRPQHSGWSISLSARFGRNHRHQEFHTQTKTRNIRGYTATTRHDDKHMIVDFSVGKDVGLGLFGKHGNSTIAVGVRVAQFDLGGHDFISSHPYISFGGNQQEHFHTANMVRRTRAIGPSLSWNGSIALVAGTDDVLSFDWQAKGALLFGRQTVSAKFQTHEFVVQGGEQVYFAPTSSSVHRDWNVIIPNSQGSAAISFAWTNAKLTVGYMADVYWSAVDGGVADHKSINRSFYGPFASISVGISPSDF